MTQTIHRGRSTGLTAAALAMAAVSGLAVVNTTNGTVAGASEVFSSHQNERQKNANSTPTSRESRLLAALLGTGGIRRPSGPRRAGYGWTNAHAKRVAAKKRRVKAHRARGRA